MLIFFSSLFSRKIKNNLFFDIEKLNDVIIYFFLKSFYQFFFQSNIVARIKYIMIKMKNCNFCCKHIFNTSYEKSKLVSDSQ